MPVSRPLRWGLLALVAPTALAAQVAAPADTLRTHTVKRGDTLWDLAASYLGDAFRWPAIYQLNREVVDDPHWIYPGEVLRLPLRGEPAIAEAPAEPAAPVAGPRDRTVFSERPGTAVRGVIAPAPPPLLPERRSVRAGEYLAAPYVAADVAPAGAGRLVASAELLGTSEATQRVRLGPQELVLFTPPSGAAASPGARFLVLARGEMIPELGGRVHLPVGQVQVERAAEGGAGAIGRLVSHYGVIRTGDLVIPVDTAELAAVTTPSAAADGRVATIRWVQGSPVLPSLTSYLLLDVGAREGVRVGDEYRLVAPRAPGAEGQPDMPERDLGLAQVVRVTPLGATVVVTGQEQPAIRVGMQARLVARMR